MKRSVETIMVCDVRRELDLNDAEIGFYQRVLPPPPAVENEPQMAMAGAADNGDDNQFIPAAGAPAVGAEKPNNVCNGDCEAGLYCGSYWHGVGNVLYGEGKSVVVVVTGTASALWNYDQTAAGLAYAVRHPIKTAYTIAKDVYDKSGSLQGQGELVGDALMSVAMAGVAKKATEVVKAAKIADNAAGVSLINPKTLMKNAHEAIESASKHSKQMGDAADGLRKQLAGHKKKLEDYLDNPYANDNKDMLKNAKSSEIKQSIYEGRIRNLISQIKNFEKQIENAIK